MAGKLTNLESVGERVYRRLRSDIIFGRLAPAQHLKLDVMTVSYTHLTLPTILRV